MKGKKYFLVLSGPAGCGKTFLVASMVEWMMTEFNNFRVWREYDLMVKIKESIDRGWEATRTLFSLIDDEVVVIDDLASQGHNEWREKTMLELLDYRFNNHLPTIFTTNLTKNDFYRIYGERIGSRLFAARNTVIDLSGSHDLRQLIF